MKRYIRSSVTNSYTDHFNYNYKGLYNFSIYSKYDNDPEKFQCQITEIHPYDLAEYAWIKKDQPASASVIKNGKRIGYIELAEWDEDWYEDEDEYIRDIIDYMCDQLIAWNAKVEPIIDRT